jgi:choline dehydrogenase-like flavoprotein
MDAVWLGETGPPGRCEAAGIEPHPDPIGLPKRRPDAVQIRMLTNMDQNNDTCHLHRTARMGENPQTSVVNGDCRSWDIPNLWICDGSVFPTVGGVNPSLAIQAIACRTADRIRALAVRGEL